MKNRKYLSLLLFLCFLFVANNGIYAQHILKTDSFELRIEKDFLKVIRDGKTNTYSNGSDEYAYWMDKFNTIEAKDKIRDQEESLKDHMEQARDHQESSQDHMEQARDHEESSQDHMEQTRDHEEYNLEHMERTRDRMEGTRDHMERTRERMEGTRDHMERTRERLEGTRNHMERTRDRMEGTRNHMERTRERMEGTRNNMERTRDHLEAMSDRIRSELVKDRLITSFESKFRFELKNKEILLNGKRLSDKLFKKYQQLLSEFPIMDTGPNFVIQSE